MAAVGYTSGDPQKVAVAGDTMTGELTLPDSSPDAALNAASKGYVDATTVAADFTGASPPAEEAPPLWRVLFTDTPATGDINIAEWRYTNASVERIAAWLNEIGHYRAEQVAGTLFDHLITLIASNATGNGRLLRFQRRNGSNQRVDTGGIDQDGRLETSFYPWLSFSDFGANYSAATSNSFGGTPYPLAGRVDTDDEVRLRGGITVGGSTTSNGDVMCVVPEALRPTSPVILMATAAGAAGAIEVNPNGNVLCRRSGTAGASYLSFDGLTYTRTAGVTG